VSARAQPACAPPSRRRPRRVHALRVLLAGAVGVAAALPIACGGSDGKLIPVANAGPLQNDFEAIAQEAETANGDCAATEAAIVKTEQDFAALPLTVDTGLRNTLRQGIDNLRSRALSLCVQPLVGTVTTSAAPRTDTTTTTTTTPTVTTTTTPTTPTPTTTPTAPGQGGGTPAPGAGEAETGAGASGQQGGTGVGESNGAGGAVGGAGAGGQEGGR
jgi:hypothetical protein